MADDNDKQTELLEAAQADYDSVPRTTEDLAERLATGNVSSRVLSTSDQGTELQRQAQQAGDVRDYRVEDNETDGYVGALDPEYVTYANETEKPGLADGGPEQVLEESIADFRASLMLPGVAGVEEDAFEDKQKAYEEAQQEARDIFEAAADDDEEDDAPTAASPSTSVAVSPGAASGASAQSGSGSSSSGSSS